MHQCAARTAAGPTLAAAIHLRPPRPAPPRRTPRRTCMASVSRRCSWEGMDEREGTQPRVSVSQRMCRCSRRATKLTASISLFSWGTCRPPQCAMRRMPPTCATKRVGLKGGSRPGQPPWSLAAKLGQSAGQRGPARRRRRRPTTTSHPVSVELDGSHAQVELVCEAEQLVVGVQGGVCEVVQRPLDVLEEACRGGGGVVRCGVVWWCSPCLAVITPAQLRPTHLSLCVVN